MKKPRNPGFHRLAHALGKLVAENIEDFDGMSAHSTIKRFQLESNVACEEIAYRINGMSVIQRIPRSLSFESLDDGEFHEFFSGYLQAHRCQLLEGPGRGASRRHG